MKTIIQTIKTFLGSNKVFILGLLAALAVTLQQFIGEPAVDWKSVGLAGGMAILSFIANQWRGQGLTITGIVGTLAYTFISNWGGGQIDWSQLILISVVAILGAVAPPAKSVDYENSDTIVKAKEPK